MLGTVVVVLFLASVVVFGLWRLWITLGPRFGTLAHPAADWMVQNLFVSCYVGFVLTVPFGVGSLVSSLPEGKQPACLRRWFLNRTCALAGRAGVLAVLGSMALMAIAILVRWMTSVWHDPATRPFSLVRRPGGLSYGVSMCWRDYIEGVRQRRQESGAAEPGETFEDVAAMMLAFIELYEPTDMMTEDGGHLWREKPMIGEIEQYANTGGEDAAG